jgi:hypothetical protein
MRRGDGIIFYPCSCALNTKLTQNLFKASGFKFTENCALHKHFSSSRFCSAEIEISANDQGGPGGTHVAQACRVWSAKTVGDASLPPGGFEINTSPASGDLFWQQIEALCAAAAQDNSETNERCGLHLHVDARDFSYYDLRRLILLYEAVEPIIYYMLSPNRRAAKYCIPCGEKFGDAVRASRQPREYKQGLLAAIYGKLRDGKPRRLEKRIGSDSESGETRRYRAMNLHSYFYRGTIEFRHMEGTLSASTILGWAEVWASLVQNAMARSEGEMVRQVVRPDPKMFRRGEDFSRALLEVSENILLDSVSPAGKAFVKARIAMVKARKWSQVLGVPLIRTGELQESWKAQAKQAPPNPYAEMREITMEHLRELQPGVRTFRISGNDAVFWATNSNPPTEDNF